MRKRQLDFNDVQVLHACIQLSGTRRLGIINHVQSLHALCICIARTRKTVLDFNDVQVLHAYIRDVGDRATATFQSCPTQRDRFGRRALTLCLPLDPFFATFTRLK